MSESFPNSRRLFLKRALGFTGGIFAAPAALAQVCGVTPSQTAGPFYPKKKITDDSINDLTVIAGHSQTAIGEVVYITGTITDVKCQPVAGALVEIWQAAASGRYNHPSDSSGLKLDPDFQNWGEFVTDADGKYAFKTIVPGHYPADTNWFRPPHIHYRVTRRGFRELVTQMYFTASSFTGDQARLVDRLNRADLILREVPNPDSVIVDFPVSLAPATVGPQLAYRKTGTTSTLEKVGELVAPAGAKIGRFDLTIRSLT